MQSVEWKAELRDPELARVILGRLGGVRAGDTEQRDTYYRVGDGLLMKREARDEPTEWIHYRRAHYLRPRLSRFTIYADEEAQSRFGTRPMPVWVVVEKRRTIWLAGSVRVHFDDVQHLGWFLEIEALVSRSANVARCHERIASAREALHPALGEPLAVGYAQLLALELETDQPDAPSAASFLR
jgi:adenylate cyclase, class 2